MFPRHALCIQVYSILSGMNSSHFSSAALLSSSEMNVKNFRQFIYRSIFSPTLPNPRHLVREHKKNIGFQLYLNTQMLAKFKDLGCRYLFVHMMSLCICSYSLMKCAFFPLPLQTESKFSNQKGCEWGAVNKLKGHRKEMLVYDN